MPGLPSPYSSQRGLASRALQSRAARFIVRIAHRSTTPALKSTAGRQLDVCDPACALCTADKTRSPSLLFFCCCPSACKPGSTVLALLLPSRTSYTAHHTDTKKVIPHMNLLEKFLGPRRVDRRTPWLQWQIPRIVPRPPGPPPLLLREL